MQETFNSLAQEKRRILIGARWDDLEQSAKFREAAELNLLDYAEVTCPISPKEWPSGLRLPRLAHSAQNPLASVHGYDPQVASLVAKNADEFDSPWVGEHLALLSESGRGAHGYVINPLLLAEAKDVAVKNVRSLQSFYARPVALELGPSYQLVGGDFASELDFVAAVARESQAQLILDVTHWWVSNLNLGRPLDFGLDVLPLERVVELHIAGCRKSETVDYWHDAHGLKPSLELLELLKGLVPWLPSVRAITFEHEILGRREDFLSTLEALQEIVA